ncbi:MAG: hypothetical protein WAW85_17095 [Gordonia sp. (in: high G+C Gram-positive bacteria)]|uniref:hypothetical protein n=1 Tax=Gordonia sp. (in: high G+C Gram-positive bacteria) TaxID=84139 RepID=UPI003BB70DB3
MLAEVLDDVDALAPGITVAAATDLGLALNSFEVSLLLTVTPGWSLPRWER